MHNDYDPQFQFAAPDWMPRSLARADYERLCAECGIEASSDAEIRRQEYGLTYAEYTQSVWLAMSREKRVGWQLNSRRLAGIEAEDKAARAARPRATVVEVRCDCGHTVPASQVMRASRGTACCDCYDRMSN